MSDYPRRGDVWAVDFRPGRGSEQSGQRPALVIQNDIGNEYGATTIIAAITTTMKPFPFMVRVPARPAGLDRESMVNLAQLLTIDKRRLHRRLGRINESIMTQVETAIKVSLGISIR